MEVSELDSVIFIALWVTNIILVGWLVYKKNLMFFFLWPSVIYSIGPFVCTSFLDNETLSRYIRPELLLKEATLFVVLNASMIFLDKLLGLNAITKKFFLNGIASHLSGKSIVRTFLLISGVTALVLQLYLLVSFGSILTGQYLGSVLTDLDTGNNALWGFSAGVYDLVLTGVILLSFSNTKGRSLPYIILYIATLGLRLLGGTRLVVIKESVVILYALLLQGKIKPLTLVYIAVPVVALGTLVGSLRLGENGDVTQPFGAASSLMLEGGLEALTLNIAYDLYDTNVGVQADILDTTQYLIASVVPSFLLAPFISREEIATLAPTERAVKLGYDTPAPVGGMNILASVTYVFGSPWIGIAVLDLIIVLILKLRYNSIIKSALVMACIINSLNIWRDPLGISLKNVTQTFIVLLALYYSYITLRISGRDVGSKVKNIHKPEVIN